jgi:hypothetical protein
MLYFTLIILLVVNDVFVDNEMFLVIDLKNLKIKSTQSFKYTHKNKMCVHIFIRVNKYYI